MTNTTIPKVTLAALLIAVSLFLAAGASAVTENECIHGGGSISAGSGCKFCVGGKFDLSEIKEAGKYDASRPGADQKTGDKLSVKSGTGNTAKTPAAN